MLYLAFDLDGTLGNFMVLWKMLCALRQNEFYAFKPVKVIPTPSEDLKWDLDISYSSFVKRVATLETSQAPLGIFRPGIFNLFKTVNQLKAEGKINGVIMYTNNGSLSLVNFIKDVINYVCKSNAFDGVFYYHHQLRVKGADGKPQPQKTWAELKVLLKSIGAPDAIKPNEVMFFDDQDHYSLITNLGANYIKVDSYNYNPPLATVLDIYYKSLKNSDLVTDIKKKNFLTYSSACTDNQPINSVEAQLQYYQKNPAKSFRVEGKGQIPTSDPTGSDYMLTAISNILSMKVNKNANANSNVNLSNAFGRKRPIRKSKTLKMPNNNKGRKKSRSNKMWSNY